MLEWKGINMDQQYFFEDLLAAQRCDFKDYWKQIS